MAERVVEGLALYVQSVEVHFESDCLRGSLMVILLIFYSACEQFF